MRAYNINKGWLFHIEDEEYRKSGDPTKKDELTTFGLSKAGEAVGFSARRYGNLPWRRIDLPHDYAVELGFDSSCRAANGLKPLNDCIMSEDHAGGGRNNVPTFPIAWYRKEFFITEEGEYRDGEEGIYRDNGSTEAMPDGVRYFLRFEGVYRDFTVWVNGVYIDRFTCGYLGVTLDVTDQLILGESNSIAVRVDCSQYDGWWYDGGGIYRDVKLMVGRDQYCRAEDLYIHTTRGGEVEIEADITNKGEDEVKSLITFTVELEGEELYRCERSVDLAYGTNRIEEKLTVESPKLWDVDEPHLYTLRVLLDGDEELCIPFGFKDVRFDPEEGFFLNGRPMKLNGVCLHQDLCGVGVALPYELTYYKYKVMKEMGVNAVRAVHNPPSPDALDVCDRLGILVMDETRLFGSSPEAIRQLETLVKRDRNHASLLMWSIGNEEHTVQSNGWGARMTRTVKKVIEGLVKDPIITYGANNGGIYRGINSELSLRGINYIRIDSGGFHPDDYHREHPNQAIFGSEEMSSLTTRGVYRIDTERGFVDAYGENGCSWSSTPAGYMKFCMSRPYYCGGFAWTGFDYRGEPSPFGGNILAPDMPRNTVSNFGIVDLCGFPKDTYYYYRAHWRREPLLHLLPAWRGYEEGEAVRVVAFTNCDEVTLYLNGRKISTEKREPYGTLQWTVPFEAGELKAVGKHGDLEITAYRRTTEPVGLRIGTEVIGDYVLARVDATDAYGEICTETDGELTFTCEGCEIVGVGNGDPTARLRERYRECEELKPLPSFTSSKPLPPPHVVRRKVVFDDGHPRFEDEFRTLWRGDPAVPEEYLFEGELEADESYSFVQFAALRGEARIYLNGVQIGSTPAPSGSVYTRAYRFCASFKNGINHLAVKIKTADIGATILEGAAFGRLVKPTVRHPLFRGSMMVILRNEKGRLKVEGEDGLCAEVAVGG